MFRQLKKKTAISLNLLHRELVFVAVGAGWLEGMLEVFEPLLGWCSQGTTRSGCENLAAKGSPVFR